ncbi:MAG: hypothetical protein ABW208_10230 [Pyrinomonadaceae bacterium]
MSRLITVLGVITAVAFAVAPDLAAVNSTAARYAMLLGLAAAAAGKALGAQDVREAGARLRGLRSRFPRRGMYTSRKTLKLFAVVGLSGLLIFNQACKSETVRGVSAGVAVGAGVLRDEVAAGVRAGDYTQAEADFLNPVIDEIESAAVGGRVRAAGGDAHTKAERRSLAFDAVEQVGGSIQRLSDHGLGVKSESGRRRLDSFLRRGRLAIGSLRAIEAALPRK